MDDLRRFQVHFKAEIENLRIWGQQKSLNGKLGDRRHLNKGISAIIPRKDTSMSPLSI